MHMIHVADDLNYHMSQLYIHTLAKVMMAEKSCVLNNLPTSHTYPQSFTHTTDVLLEELDFLLAVTLI